MKSNVVLILSICITTLCSCKGNKSIQGFAESILNERVGEPALFLVGEKRFSKDAYKEYVRNLRLYFEKKPPLFNPEEARLYLENYINESILLSEAIGDIDFSSQSFREYIKPYLVKGILDFYIFEKTGGLKVSDEIANETEILAKLKETGILKKENLTESEKAVLKEFIYWRKLELSAKNRAEEAKDILAKIKKRNKVTIIP
ncbi:hypothetical protein EHQ23_07045 [Leptospira bourretii]|uniref:Lipoprotein n=1 Tax=Leptospira bourretii TaxID=2484962 RepID=A0A4R9IGP9_9LEPT|nr:hypothetical protein [Leptospira bourretii]TGK87221.1 hypothetical protein EHQ23_07045 [Leptospira bourretii]TGK87598.1 hypothetical protein EHQ26_19540 [Leptospira bourretii]TGL25622.1 hypothetical protein EHQ47_01335 [Leptospira bourretii]TGL38044.1 hypothetical protein EHQ45_05565 [Leptospira bourretii]